MARRTISGSRALVTGASSGIGRALALELGRQGADMVLVARREDRLQALAEELRRLGRRCECVAGDVTDPAVRQAAIDLAGRTLGGIDILLNNAGVTEPGPFAEADERRLRHIFEVNFFAPLELIRAALPTLREGRRPIIVNVASILSHLGLPQLSEYRASKFALRGFSEALRAELRPQGIDVLVVSPATVATDMMGAVQAAQGNSPWRVSRGAAPETIARKTVRAIARGRRELLPGAAPKAVYLLQRFCPTLVAWALERKQ